MFDNIINFFKKFSKEAKKDSKDMAKERLHLVLMQDRANVSADFLEMMKQEIIEVIKKYIDVDENSIDVKLTNKVNSDGTTGAPALYANIPIVSLKDETKKININRNKEVNNTTEEVPKEVKNNDEQKVEDTKQEKNEEKEQIETSKNDEKNKTSESDDRDKKLEDNEKSETLESKKESQTSKNEEEQKELEEVNKKEENSEAKGEEPKNEDSEKIEVK